MKTRSQTLKEQQQNLTLEYKTEYPSLKEAAAKQDASKHPNEAPLIDPKPSNARKRKDRREKAAAKRAAAVYVPKARQPEVQPDTIQETTPIDGLEKAKTSFTDEVKDGKIVMHSSDTTSMVKALVAAELATVSSELASIKEEKEEKVEPVEISVLPTYTMLRAVCEAAKNQDLGKHGKEDVSELHLARKDKLSLVDIIIYHLDRGTFKLKAQNEIQAEIEKRDILMGVMSLVKKEIKGTYRFFSPDWSVVHKNYRVALQVFNKAQMKQGRIAFANYFLENDLANYKGKPVEFYTSEIIRKEMFEKFGIKEEELFKLPESASSKKKEVRGGFSWLGFMSPAATATPATEQKSNVTPAPSVGLKS